MRTESTCGEWAPPHAPAISALVQPLSPKH
jgi:hypothetical protein